MAIKLQVVFLFLLIHATFAIPPPNIYAVSGINIALSQEVLNKLVYVASNLTSFLEGFPLNLYFPDMQIIYQVSEMDDQFYPFANFSISHMNFEQLSFEPSQSSIVMMEPIQQIKFYLSNLQAKVAFLINLSLNPKIYPNTQPVSTPVNLTVQNGTMSLAQHFYIDDKNNKLKVDIDSMTITLDPSNIDLECIEDQLFGFVNCKLFDNFKYYHFSTINEQLEMMNPYIDILCNAVLDKMQDALYLLQKEYLYIFIYYGFYPGSILEQNPLIYDEFFSMRMYGQVYPNWNYDRYTPEDNYTSSNYLPISFETRNENYSFQWFFSQFTCQELYFAYQIHYNYTSLSFNYPTSSQLMDFVFPTFTESFPGVDEVTFVFTQENPGSYNITAGNFLFYPNSYNLFVKEANHSRIDTDILLSFEMFVDQLTFTAVIESETIYFTFINYNLLNMTLLSTSNSSFEFNSEYSITVLNSLLVKNLIFNFINTYSKDGFFFPTFQVFGIYEEFFRQTFTDLKAEPKDEYLIMSSNFEVRNMSLYETIVIKFLQTFTNGTKLEDLITASFIKKAVEEIIEKKEHGQSREYLLEWIPSLLPTIKEGFGDFIYLVKDLFSASNSNRNEQRST